jgi:hypothetical protein
LIKQKVTCCVEPRFDHLQALPHCSHPSGTDGDGQDGVVVTTAMEGTNKKKSIAQHSLTIDSID